MKIIIVDDHLITVNGIKHVLYTQPDIEVIAVAFSANELKQCLATGVLPDVILLDINLPDGNGMDLCKMIVQQYPTIKILTLTGFKELSYIQKMIQNGAKGYLLKNAMAEEIIEGIKTVFAGETYFSAEIETLYTKNQQVKKPFLTPREIQLLNLVAEGYTNKEIADKLYLGVETVNSYRKNLLIKMGVKNSAAMVKLAIKEKWIEM
ncbi:MAG: response regulator transcription factor, partial [Bacteroidales bacterium]